MLDFRAVPLATRRVFLGRIARSLTWSAGLIGATLGIVVVGYKWTTTLSWSGAFLDASLIGGIGNIEHLPTLGSRIFASCYALFSGLALVGASGLVLGPILHRMIHKFHLEDVERAAAQN